MVVLPLPSFCRVLDTDLPLNFGDTGLVAVITLLIVGLGDLPTLGLVRERDLPRKVCVGGFAVLVVHGCLVVPIGSLATLDLV